MPAVADGMEVRAILVRNMVWCARLPASPGVAALMTCLIIFGSYVAEVTVQDRSKSGGIRGHGV